MYKITLPNRQTIKITDRTFNAIKQFLEGKITRRRYQAIVRQDINIIRYHIKYKVPYKTIYEWLIWSYENHKYEKIKVKRETVWYKVLAVMTFVYSRGRGRELEGRLLIDVPKFVYEKRDHLEAFCKDAIEVFFELAGYSTELIMESDKYFGMTVLRQFKDKLSRKPKYYIEIYDGDYGRYPFRANGTFMRYYWRDWRKAFYSIYEDMEIHIEHEWEYHSGVRKYAGE